MAFSKTPRKKKYYIIFVNESSYDSITNSINNNIYYFGAVPKKNTKSYFENIIKWTDTCKMPIYALKRDFDLINIFFPIYNAYQQDFFQIDARAYKNKQLTIPPKIFKMKNNMLLSQLYSCLNDFGDCSKDNQVTFRIVEIYGELQYLNKKDMVDHIASNHLALLNLKKGKDGDRIFTTIIYDQGGKIIETRKAPIKCLFLFQGEENQSTSALDINNKLLNDTILYKKITVN